MYLAVYYLDWVMNEYEVLEPNYTLFAICSLLIACKLNQSHSNNSAKYDEFDAQIPMI